ncbi:copper chaperone PCu(A)C [Corynebacterium sp. sy017]|uniref:copper chaperone PCu(A)C n=1 Tax=unclassified Corynebacterium TaxID=2624378 RepID=UPI0011862EA2|nr:MULTISPECIES: copper chaperone PCu(A)C [unclassified Corynebacterium]MBP3087734.1 copper chaperone PCu(A)C [Corynebacterium sp. sy017]QDZ42710.1 copper chaperone PCu(A)C [Corynebacterium sp. sy039]TSD92286.1 copper chaperone PCu(A)C [Corynebacterium sp. SY003]
MKFHKNVVCAVALSALTLAGCSNSETDSQEKVDTAASAAAKFGTSTTESKSDSESESEAVSFEDAYVKSAKKEDGMTAVFGVLKNNTGAEVNIVSASVSVAASSYELHEVVDGVMRPKEGGFVIPAGGSLTLQPGAEHIMLMGLQEDVEAGEDYSVTLNLADGTEIVVDDVPSRSISSGNEDYSGAAH